MSEKSRILVVDDDPVNVQIINETFQDQYDIRSVTSGQEALNVMNRFRPDLVLLDVMMPGMDGYETCRHIRMMPENRFTKVLMVSARSLTEEKLNGYECGADDYITKPFVDDELKAKVAVYLKLKFVEEFEGFKSNVLKLISNDIRSPLSSVMGLFGSLINHKGELEYEARTTLEQIVKYGSRLLQLCDESLLLCDLKDGKRAIPEDIVLVPFINDIICELAPKLEEKEIHIEFKNQINHLIQLDKTLMRKAFKLILENSILYTPVRGYIHIQAVEEKDHFVVTISDNGKGITNRFFHEIANSNQDVDAAGEGVSFTVAQVATRLNGGELVYMSNHPTGVSFQFRLIKESSLHHEIKQYSSR